MIEPSRRPPEAKFIIFATILILFIPFQTYASEFKTGDNPDVLQRDTIRDDLYIFGNYSEVRGLVEGDLVTFCYSFSSDGNIGGSANIFAYDIDIIGEIQGSARLFSYKARINGPIQGNALIFTNDCRVEGRTIIGRDLNFGSNYAKIDGTVMGNVEGKASRITVSGTIEGDAEFEAERLLIVSPAVIKGDLTYKSPDEAIIDDDVVIDGEVLWKEQEYDSDDSGDASIPAVVRIIFFIMTLATGMILILLFREHTDESILQIDQKFWVTLAIGCLSFIILTFGAIVPAVLIVGIPVSLLMLTSATILFYIGKIYVSIALGRYLFKRLAGGRKAIALEFIVGLVILAILFAIPVIGWIVYILTFLLGTGAAVSGIISLHRKYKTATAGETSSG
jgi:cytoskeletal protein CcmA (bactofilin family)